MVILALLAISMLLKHLVFIIILNIKIYLILYMMKYALSYKIFVIYLCEIIL